jgi:membrane protein
VPATGVERARRGIATARSRYEGSYFEAVAAELRELNFFDRTLAIGAEMLWSTLPFVILLSSLARARIDDDVSRHIGLDSQGTHSVQALFRGHPTHAFVPVATGLIFTFAGVVAVISSIQAVYEHIYHQEHRGWRDLPRQSAWAAVLLVALIAEGATGDPVRDIVGPVVTTLLTLATVTVFLVWTIHFLLRGKVSWRRVVAPAVTTGLLWTAFGLFSSVYFSPIVHEDSKLYGSIGVVFSFLTWFFLMGVVIVLGAALGATWQERRSAPAKAGGGDARL